jgi:beta-phosphoglucomutase-like phosphatase (HAD superfamily)
LTGICVIFDLDGTLVDSEGLCNQAFLDLLPQLSDAVESLIQRYRGKKLAPILADLEGRLCQFLSFTIAKSRQSDSVHLYVMISTEAG